MEPPKCKDWRGVKVNTFEFKAQQNLMAAASAREAGCHDIEANRTYYALHQLACELARMNKMQVKKHGKHATSRQPWRIDHGSYESEIREVVQIDHVDQTFGTWKGFRQSADYNPEQVCSTEHWKRNIRRLRERATEVSEKIHEILAT